MSFSYFASILCAPMMKMVAAGLRRRPSGPMAMAIKKKKMKTEEEEDEN